MLEPEKEMTWRYSAMMSERERRDDGTLTGHAIAKRRAETQHESCWYGVRKGKTARWTGDRKQSTVWDVDRIKKGTSDGAIHSTQKPIELFRRPIRNHDAPEIYDPFAGTGTAMIAAEELDRQCFSMEIDPVYVAVTLDRCEGRGLDPGLADSR